MSLVSTSDYGSKHTALCKTDKKILMEEKLDLTSTWVVHDTCQTCMETDNEMMFGIKKEKNRQRT